MTVANPDVKESVLTFKNPLVTETPIEDLQPTQP